MSPDLSDPDVVAALRDFADAAERPFLEPCELDGEREALQEDES